MGHIIPKLNLNKTPQAVESNSLVFAKNIKVNTDGSLGRDNSIDNVVVNGNPINFHNIAGFGEETEYLGHIVGVNACIYFFIKRTTNVVRYFIYEYNEIENSLRQIHCNWTYHGGKITGCVTTNNTNQKILTISEYNCEELVPLKHINLSECKTNDDESIYTQNPNIPITNLHFTGYYSCTIPNGVYQFFIRYKVRDGFYTNWFPASRELYAGHAKKINTIQGSLKYVDVDKDCDRSFIFEVSHLFSQYIKNYKEFQIGFIVSSDNQTVGRTWKSFNFDVTQIYFDYNKNFIEEELVDNFLESSYDIFNSKNVIAYKNKLYVSNYIESNLNPKLEDYASDIDINLNCEEIDLQNIGELGINGHKLEKNNDNYYNRININSQNVAIGQVLANPEITTASTDRHTDILTSFYGGFPTDVYNDVKSKLNKYGIYFIAIECIEYDEHNNQLIHLISILDKDPHFDNLDVDSGSDWPTIVNETSTLLDDTDIKFCDKSVDVKSYILSLPEVTSKITYIGEDNKFYVKVVEDNVEKYIEVANIQYAYFSLNVDERNIRYNENIPISWNNVTYNSPVNIKNIYGQCSRYDYKVTLTPNAITSILGYVVDENTRSLLPYTKYNFYIHYVTNNGIVTNGLYIGQKEYTLAADNLNIPSTPYIIYPTFTNIRKPEGYSAFFISAIKAQNDIATLIDTDTSSNNLYDCIELDALLYSSNELLELGTRAANGSFKVLTKEGKYYGSNTDIVEYFGTAGFVDAGVTDNPPMFVKFSNIIDIVDINNLVKITPFLELDDAPVSLNNPKDLNLPGFVCEVTKLNRNEADKIYVSGFDVFNKTLNQSDVYDANIDEVNQFVNLKTTPLFYIWSNFNLNCLTLRENLNKGIRSWNETDNNTEVLRKQWIVSVNSQNCSLIYDLPLMYKEYTRKYYSVVDDKTFTVFDNTVRSSNVDVDEVFRSIYKFDAEDYYNVPTNRGIIINLFSINNEIFVHTEHGLFKFTDSSLLKVGDGLYTSNKNVGVSESSPFDIGIAEIVDSQYGHGGLQNKEHSLITFNGYIFYDSLVRTIYSYDNQSGIQNITSPVRKIIDWFEPTDVTFVSDDANNRFFITLSKVVDDLKQVICLSYSFIAKSFVSIHDIDYTKAFNSRLNTYFIQNNNLLKVNYKDFGSYVNNKKSILSVPDEVSINESNIGSCIDIIINDGYETIKSLSHIHWICQNINNYVGENPYNVAEELISKYGGDKIRVYSDQTWSDLLPINIEQNIQAITDANSYQYPRYNNGIWTMNYFRDIKNADSDYISDEMSLIHGKYVVVRFIFDANKKNFKFENLNINFKNYEKV